MFSRNQLIFTIISLILVVPPFFSGGRSATAAVVVFILAFPLVYFVFSVQPDFKKMYFLKNPFIPLGGFIVLAAVSYFYSSAPAMTFNDLFYWIFYALLFFSVFYYITLNYKTNKISGKGRSSRRSETEWSDGRGATLRRDFGNREFRNSKYISSLSDIARPTVEKFSKILIWLGVALSIVGIYFFWITEIYSYLRLVSTFYHHNAFAAFLLVPFLILLSHIFTESDSKKLRLFSVLTVLFAIAFFFTYSRGGWISFVAAFALLIWFLRNKIKKINILYFSAALAVSIILIFGLRAIKEKQAGLESDANSTTSQVVESISVEEPKKIEKKTQYLAGTKEDNALLARFTYWRGAWEIFQNNPVFGTGFGSYKIAYQKYLKDIRYFSVAPHNFYLKVLAELGIVGFLFWMWFVGLLVYFIWKSVVYAVAKGDFVVVGFGLGLLAFLINIGGELSLYFPANAIMFFVVAAIVSKYYYIIYKS